MNDCTQNIEARFVITHRTLNIKSERWLNLVLLVLILCKFCVYQILVKPLGDLPDLS